MIHAMLNALGHLTEWLGSTAVQVGLGLLVQWFGGQ